MSVELGSEIAVHVPTQEDYDWLMKYLDDKGITWVSGEPTWEGNEWEKYSNTTSINFKEERGISFSPYSFYKKYGYEIITLDEYKRREGLMDFKLKVLDVIEYDDGERFIIVQGNGELNKVGKGFFHSNSNRGSIDKNKIYKVYRSKVDSCFSNTWMIFEYGANEIDDDWDLVWERKKNIKEYTMKELQEKLGEEFKLIK